jgi:hypothetical protein
MGRVTDISPYGVGVRSMHLPAVGERVIVTLRPPSAAGRELSLMAELVHRRLDESGAGPPEGRIGLEFLNLSERRRDELELAFHGIRSRKNPRPPRAISY